MKAPSDQLRAVAAKASAAIADLAGEMHERDAHVDEVQLSLDAYRVFLRLIAGREPGPDQLLTLIGPCGPMEATVSTDLKGGQFRVRSRKAWASARLNPFAKSSAIVEMVGAFELPDDVLVEVVTPADAAAEAERHVN